MDKAAQFLADAIALADTGAFRSAAEMRRALVLIAPDRHLVDGLIAEEDALSCLNQRCARAKRARGQLN